MARRIRPAGLVDGAEAAGRAGAGQGALDGSAPGPLRVVSLCAVQGRDLLGVLADHPRRDDVLARLVELDPRNTDAAREVVRAAGLRGVEVVTADAALTDHYVDFVPADLVLVCRIFGNISDDDIHPFWISLNR